MRLSVCLATLSSSCFSSLFSLSKMALPIALNGLPGARTGCTRCFEALLLHLHQQLSLLVGNIFSFPFFLSLSPLSIPPHVAIGFPFVVANVSIQSHWLDQVDEIRCVCVCVCVCFGLVHTHKNSNENFAGWHTQTHKHQLEVPLFPVATYFIPSSSSVQLSQVQPGSIIALFLFVLLQLRWTMMWMWMWMCVWLTSEAFNDRCQLLLLLLLLFQHHLQQFSSEFE